MALPSPLHTYIRRRRNGQSVVGSLAAVVDATDGAKLVDGLKDGQQVEVYYILLMHFWSIASAAFITIAAIAAGHLMGGAPLIAKECQEL